LDCTCLEAKDPYYLLLIIVLAAASNTLTPWWSDLSCSFLFMSLFCVIRQPTTLCSCPVQTTDQPALVVLLQISFRFWVVKPGWLFQRQPSETLPSIVFHRFPFHCFSNLPFHCLRDNPLDLSCT
jgi:hypothetical protein